MQLPIREALLSASRYWVRNPMTLAKVLGHAAGLRLAIPLDAARWAVANLLTGDKVPSDVTVAARPPALAVGATLNVMGNKLRIGSAIRINDVQITGDEMLFTVQINDVDVNPLGDPNSNLAKLINSGALDFSKIGTLLNTFARGKTPPAVVSAKEDTLVLDLMQVEQIAENPIVRRVISTLTPVMNVVGIRTEDDLLLLQLKATPAGITEAVAAARG